MIPECEQTYWGFLRGLGHKKACTGWEDEDYEKYLNDISKLRIGCALFTIVAVIAFALLVSLIMKPQG